METQYNPKFTAKDIESLTIINGNWIKEEEKFLGGQLNFQTTKGNFNYKIPITFAERAYRERQWRRGIEIENGLSLVIYQKYDEELLKFLRKEFKKDSEILENELSHSDSDGICSFLRKTPKFIDYYQRHLKENKRDKESFEEIYRTCPKEKEELINYLKNLIPNMQKFQKIIPKELKKLILDTDFPIEYGFIHEFSVGWGDIRGELLFMSFKRDYFPIKVIAKNSPNNPPTF